MKARLRPTKQADNNCIKWKQPNSPQVIFEKSVSGVALPMYLLKLGEKKTKQKKMKLPNLSMDSGYASKFTI